MVQASKIGKQRVELGQLEGRAGTGTSATPWGVRGKSNTADRAVTEWVVHAPNGGTVTLTGQHDRAGKISTEVELG